MYKRERKLETHHFCECGGIVFNHITEKAQVVGGWPMQVKSIGICECGAIHWRKDLTNYSKEEYRLYLKESENSRKKHLKLR